MVVKQVCDVKNEQIVIPIPDVFRGKKSVLITIDDTIESYTDKIALMKKASCDPHFLADMQEVDDDFAPIEHETI